MRTAAKTKNRGRKSQRQLFNDLLRGKCDGCGDVTSVVHFDHYTRTGNKRRKKLCIPCFTGIQ